MAMTQCRRVFQRDGSSGERLRKRTEADHRLVQASLARLAAVADPLPPDRPVRELGGDPLLAACRLVADRLDMAVTPPAGGWRGKKRDDPLGDIARASH